MIEVNNPLGAVICLIIIIIITAIGISKNSVRHVGVALIILCGILLLAALIIGGKL